jgi:hypothetical protein
VISRKHQRVIKCLSNVVHDLKEIATNEIILL